MSDPMTPKPVLFRIWLWRVNRVGLRHFGFAAATRYPHAPWRDLYDGGYDPLSAIKEAFDGR